MDKKITDNNPPACHGSAARRIQEIRLQISDDATAVVEYIYGPFLSDEFRGNISQLDPKTNTVTVVSKNEIFQQENEVSIQIDLKSFQTAAKLLPELLCISID